MQMERRIKHLKRNDIAEAIGWVGTVGILTSYILLSLGIISGQSYLYHSLVLIGSAGLALITYRHRSFQPLAVNLTFCVFAVIALIRLFITQ